MITIVLTNFSFYSLGNRIHDVLSIRKVIMMQQRPGVYIEQGPQNFEIIQRNSKDCADISFYQDTGLV